MLFGILSATMALTASSGGLPLGMLGTWTGKPAFQVLGPWGIDYTIHIGESGEGGFYIADNANRVPGSWQRWYVFGDENIYCGYLKNFGDPYLHTTQTPLTLKAQPSNDANTRVFCAHGTDGMSPNVRANCTGCECMQWTLSLSPDNSTLFSQMLLSTPSKHLEVTFERTGPKPPADNVTGLADFQCNFSAGPVPDSVESGQAGSLVPARHPRVHGQKCPFDTPKPVVSAAVTAGGDVPGLQSKGCAMLNKLLGFQVSFTKGLLGAYHVTVEAPLVGQQYISVGFKPTDLPPSSIYGMEGALIIAGYNKETNGAGCVRDMRIEEYVGAPKDVVNGTKHFFTDAKVEFESGKTKLHFVVPWAWALKHDKMLFALGTVAGGGCAAPLAYHSGNRGWWPNPLWSDKYFPDKC